MTVSRRVGLLVLTVLLLAAVAFGLKWFRTPAPPASPAASPTAKVQGTNPSPPVSGGTGPSAAGADWMQPYRNLTLDQAFETVARRVRFEPYTGVQRGARGTARAQAGNAIDQAMLLAAILRGARYEVRFVRGSLTPENAGALLRGLYPPRVPSVELAAKYSPYETTADARLTELIRDHYWIEVNQGSTWLPLDPSFPRAQIGEAYATAADRFTEPPEALYQRVEFAWKIETAQRPAQEVARWSGTVADLGLQPISLVVDAIPGTPKQPAPAQPSAGGMFGGALSGAPQPQPQAQDAQPSTPQSPTGLRYVRAIDAETRRPAKGNVSLASRPASAVRREWVEIKLSGPGGLARTIDRALYERETDTPPIRAEHRRYTILIVPGAVSQAYVDEEIGRARGTLKLDEWRGETTRLTEATSGSAAKTSLARAAAIETAVGRTGGYLMALSFAGRSDALTDQIASANHLAVARPIPRILVASNETQGDKGSEARSTVSLDLRLDEVQPYVYPGFPSRAAQLFQTARGMQESVLEGELVAQWTGREAVSTAALMQVANRTRVQLLTVNGANRSALDEARDLTARARREIEAAVASGHEVILPAQPIGLEGRPRWGWWDVDPDSGAIIGVMEGGQHQAMAEYNISTEDIGLDEDTGFYLGCIVGSNTTMFLVCGKLLETGTVTKEIIAAVEAYVEQGACNTMCPSETGASASISVGDDCFSTGKSMGAKASIDFCSGYNDGFKCAGSLILEGLKGEKGSASVSGSAEITLPDCGGK